MAYQPTPSGFGTLQPIFDYIYIYIYIYIYELKRYDRVSIRFWYNTYKNMGISEYTGILGNYSIFELK